MSTSPETSLTSAVAPARKKRRAWRWVVRVVVGLPLLSLLAVVLLMRSPLVGRMVGAAVAELTGGEWKAERAVIAPNGQLVIEGLSLRAPGTTGEAGEVLAAPQAIADIDWSGLPVVRWFFGGAGSSGSGGSGGPQVRGIRLTRPVFRLSQSIDDDSLNIGHFRPVPSTGKPMAELPRLDVVDGRVEFAEHSDRSGGYTLLNTIPVSGSFDPVSVGPNPRPVYALRLQETGRAQTSPGADAGGSDRRALILDGRIDLATNDGWLQIYNFSLDAWPADSVPRFMRDIWRRLNMQGRVSEAIFRYGNDTGVEADIIVEDISMIALIPAKKPEAPDAFLTLRRVNGQIALSASGLHADLNGLVEDQSVPSRVVLDTYGTDLNCSLRCEISGEHINISRHPAFLPYVPDVVKQYLNWFGGPTADVRPRVVITRGDPVGGQPATFVVQEGTLEFRNGAAAFHKFPYPFHNMSGEVSFGADEINIRRIKGDGPSGAMLSASGRISPLGDDAAVDLVIGVRGAPVDDHLLDAMQPSYRRMLEVLFCREKYEGLLGNGLVALPGSKAAGAGPRPFAFGGLADVGIKVGCPRGRHTPWYTKVDVDFASAGLVPEPFGYPILARDVHLFIDDHEARFTRGTFAGLHGGSAELSARVEFGEHADDPSRPVVRIDAVDIPVDRLLLSTVPGDANGSDTGGPISAASVLRRLEIEGRVDCHVSIDPLEEARRAERATFTGPVESPDVEWALEVKLDKLMARPRHRVVDSETGLALCLRELSGTLHVSHDRVHIDPLVARIGSLEAGHSGSMLDAAAAGGLVAGLNVDLRPMERRSGTDEPLVRASISIDDLDLADRIEDAIGVFEPDAAARFAAIRAERRPAGTIDADIVLEAFDDSAKMLTAQIGDSTGLAFDALGGRLALDSPRGRIRLDRKPGPGGDEQRLVLGFAECASGLRFNDDPPCEATVSGRIDVSDGRAEAGVSSVEATVRGGRFESGLLRQALARMADAETAERVNRLGLSGLFDLSLDVTGGGNGGFAANGWIEPRALAFDLRGKPYHFDSIGGRLTFEASGGSARGRVERGRVARDDWSAQTDAAWSIDRTSGLSVEAELSARSQGLSPTLIELLPAAVREAIPAISLRCNGGVGLDDSNLSLRVPVDEDPVAGFRGEIRFDDVSSDFGLKLDHGAGLARVNLIAEPETDDSESARLELRLDRATLASILLTDASADLVWKRSGAMTSHGMSARSHGGLVVADLDARPRAAPLTGKDVAIDLTVEDVAFASLRSELAAANVVAEADEVRSDGSSTADPIAPGSAPDPSRGLMDARMSVAFTTGDPFSRRGRGSVRITDGDVLNMPIIFPLVRLSNLMLPFGQERTSLDSTYYIDGPVAVFEDITVRSDSVAIVGGGTITWPALDLDMSFNSRSMQRIPVWSDVFEALRNEVMTTRVTGTVGSPVVRSEPLTGTRRMLGDAINPRSARPSLAAPGIESATPLFSPLDAGER
ncbi:MAG: hypothetical protein IT438_04565 [Phycisphaerales bacterium]|nr:hypothetical protein [Phycisphaerales bacterium]